MEERPLVVGAVATHPDSVFVWDALRAHFQRVGAPMDYLLCSTADRLTDQLLGGAVDVAWLPALAFIRARAKLGALVVPILIGDRHRDLVSHLVVRAGSDLAGGDAPPSLRGRTLALGAADDAATRVLPVFHLAGGRGALDGVHVTALEVDLGKGGETARGAHAILDAVRDGRADAGFVGEREWRAAGARAEGLVVAWSTPPCDGPVFCALASGPTGLRRDFERAMRALTSSEPAHAELLARCGVTAWVSPREGGHQSLRTAVAELSSW